MVSKLLLKEVEELCWEVCESEGLIVELNAEDVIELLGEDRVLSLEEIEEIKNINFWQVYLTCELRNEMEGIGLDNC